MQMNILTISLNASNWTSRRASIYRTTMIFERSFGSVRAELDFKKTLIFLISKGSFWFKRN